MTHPRKIAADMSHSPNLAARETGLTKREVREIRELQFERRSRRPLVDPLITASATRVWRTPSARAKSRREFAERRRASLDSILRTMAQEETE